ncbi:class I adenylate-forming enzyme family protein [Falsiroseomonas sp.]|uniref:class I adenylate-forming enzyme family protein n=1 Tax=Falsiroseomonas sp. TaxID=2870721 RepID=UPI003566046C
MLQAIPGLHPSGNLGAFFHAAVVAFPERVALVDLSGAAPRQITYAALEEEIRRAVTLLRSAGVARGGRIALALGNSATYLVGFLAAMRLGAIPVPVNHKLGREAIGFMLRDSGATGILADPTEAASSCEAAEQAGLALRLATRATREGWRDFDALLAAAAPDPHVEPMDFDGQAFQPYTAGSTGMPKGICLTHGGMLWGIEQSERYWPVSPQERGIVAAPMFHKNAMRGVIKPLLRGGGSVVILPRFEATSFLRALSEWRVTGAGGVPAMYAEIARHEALIRDLDFSALKLLSMGSAAVPVELLERLAALFPGVAVKESYGLTEGGGVLRPPLDGREVPRGSVGVVPPETEVKLLAPDGSEHPNEGELWVRCPYVLKEYVNRPELTAARIRDGWLCTGDLFRVDAEGFFHFLGRSDDMFVCGGENVYPKEVENLLLGHPEVDDAVVVPLPHATKGMAPAAAIRPRAGTTPDPQAIKDFCAANGPTHTIPRAVLLVEELPLTSAGKPDRKAVQAMLEVRFGALAPRREEGA